MYKRKKHYKKKDHTSEHIQINIDFKERKVDERITIVIDDDENEDLNNAEIYSQKLPKKQNIIERKEESKDDVIIIEQDEIGLIDDHIQSQEIYSDFDEEETNIDILNKIKFEEQWVPLNRVDPEEEKALIEECEVDEWESDEEYIWREKSERAVFKIGN